MERSLSDPAGTRTDSALSTALTAGVLRPGGWRRGRSRRRYHRRRLDAHRVRFGGGRSRWCAGWADDDRCRPVRSDCPAGNGPRRRLCPGRRPDARSAAQRNDIGTVCSQRNARRGGRTTGQRRRAIDTHRFPLGGDRTSTCGDCGRLHVARESRTCRGSRRCDQRTIGQPVCPARARGIAGSGRRRTDESRRIALGIDRARRQHGRPVGADRQSLYRVRDSTRWRSCRAVGTRGGAL
jgi:hypothetical protein